MLGPILRWWCSRKGHHLVHVSTFDRVRTRECSRCHQRWQEDV